MITTEHVVVVVVLVLLFLALDVDLHIAVPAPEQTQESKLAETDNSNMLASPRNSKEIPMKHSVDSIPTG